MKQKPIGRVFALCALCALFAVPAVLHGLETVELQLDVRLTWNATRRDPGPRCFTVRVPEPGFLQIGLTTTAPSTSPGIFVLTSDDEGEAPDALQRIESVLLRTSRAGEHLICLTSGRPLGRVELLTSFVGDELSNKERDEEETELEPDP